MKNKKEPQRWPEDKTETVDIEKLVNPIYKAIKSAFKISKKENLDILSIVNKWEGFDDTGPSGRACGPTTISEILSENSLKNHSERGRDLLNILIFIAVRYGIEQGRRLQLEECQYIHEAYELLKKTYLSLTKKSK